MPRCHLELPFSDTFLSFWLGGLTPEVVQVEPKAVEKAGPGKAAAPANESAAAVRHTSAPPSEATSTPAVESAGGWPRPPPHCNSFLSASPRQYPLPCSRASRLPACYRSGMSQKHVVLRFEHRGVGARIDVCFFSHCAGITQPHPPAVQSAKPAATEAAAGVQWQCTACTLLNSGEESQCSVCQTPRPGYTAPKVAETEKKKEPKVVQPVPNGAQSQAVGSQSVRFVSCSNLSLDCFLLPSHNIPHAPTASTKCRRLTEALGGQVTEAGHDQVAAAGHGQASSGMPPPQKTDFFLSHTQVSGHPTR